MDRVQEHGGAASPEKTGRAPVLFLLLALVATAALCGWNMRSSSSGPTSVTIVGVNGSASDSAGFRLPVSGELAESR